MTSRALVAKRIPSGVPHDFAREAADVADLGLKVLHFLPHGLVVEGNNVQYKALGLAGFRVKVFQDTHLVHVGRYTIDITAAGPPALPVDLQVPPGLIQTWSHYLVQLDGPRDVTWQNQIAALGFEIVEPVDAYGLFVVGQRQQLDNLQHLRFVKWTGRFEPGYRVHANLQGLAGQVRYLSIGVFPPGSMAAVAHRLTQLGATIRSQLPADQYDGKYAHFIVVAPSGQVPLIAQIPAVRWLEKVSDAPTPEGERETQIAVGNLNSAATQPVPGYQAWLASMGLDGTNTVVAICDTGVDAGPNNNLTGHLDLRGRQVAALDYTSGMDQEDTWGMAAWSQVASLEMRVRLWPSQRRWGPAFIGAWESLREPGSFRKILCQPKRPGHRPRGAII